MLWSVIWISQCKCKLAIKIAKRSQYGRKTRMRRSPQACSGQAAKGLHFFGDTTRDDNASANAVAINTVDLVSACVDATCCAKLVLSSGTFFKVLGNAEEAMGSTKRGIERQHAACEICCI